ncbi:zinc-binding alcohol dehydrogenase family protein [Phyllobacterium salinisoli]|uniref:Zinc-binding alcohol dehydrogenase family protein n=1 Tax=Phyllobacterium salinisoli TaxID=1899321 RepID=A0A368K3I2_9HYPH|nr:zinc-binding alcohol dehydrogenase family protein [Phyllobacterium salinisoli]RCS23801.1 zinc-binding alcohol dehydrogenase family protein [Phyllobacterium salinisoli]
MKAAVVTDFGKAPAYGDFRDPVAGKGETIVRVHAAPLSPIVKALASGKHYTSGAQAGFVPGVDGVGTDPEGRRVYFLFPKAPFGSMGELALVSDEMIVAIPDEISDVRAAAVATGGLASWVALTRRASVQPGATVLVNGATGAAGGMAVQIARHFGAGRVIAVGRNKTALDRLDVESRIALDDRADEALRAEFDRGVDVVLDFLWGEPAARVIAAATKNRGARSGEPRVRYVQLGTVAGDEISIRGDAFRSSGLELMGSGIGSVAIRELLAGARELLTETNSAGFDAPVTTLPLMAVADAWTGPSDIRYILSAAGHTY